MKHEKYDYSALVDCFDSPVGVMRRCDMWGLELR